MDIQKAKEINEALKPFKTTVGEIYYDIRSKEHEIVKLEHKLDQVDSNEDYNLLLRLIHEKKEEVKHLKSAW